MGYSTDFKGWIGFTPAFSSDLIRQFNSTADKRNNTYADGDEGSFDDVSWKALGKVMPSSRSEGFDMMAVFRDSSLVSLVPSCWCGWELKADEPEGLSRIMWNGAEKFYHYIQWLQFAVDWIVAHHPEPHLLQFRPDDVIHWATGSEDQGEMSVERNKYDGRWQVRVKPFFVIEPAQVPELPDVKETAELKPRFMIPRFDFGGYVLVVHHEGGYVVERKGQAIDAHSDPWKHAECLSEDSQMYAWKPEQVQTLFNLCAKAVRKHDNTISNEAAAKLPKEVTVKLRTGRVCSGCGDYFLGGAAALSFWVHPHGWSGYDVLGRNCSMRCAGRRPITFPERATKVNDEGESQE